MKSNYKECFNYIGISSVQNRKFCRRQNNIPELVGISNSSLEAVKELIELRSFFWWEYQSTWNPTLIYFRT